MYSGQLKKKYKGCIKDEDGHPGRKARQPRHLKYVREERCTYKTFYRWSTLFSSSWFNPLALSSSFSQSVSLFLFHSLYLSLSFTHSLSLSLSLSLSFSLFLSFSLSVFLSHLSPLIFFLIFVVTIIPCPLMPSH